MKILLVNKNYLMSLSLDKDPSIGWGDIALFVTLYNLEDEILGVFSSWIIATFCSEILDQSGNKIKIWWTQKMAWNSDNNLALQSM